MNKIRIAFISLLLICLIFPVVFTLKQMGYFKYQPKVEIKNTVTDPDARVLRVVADYDFSPYSFIDSNNEISGLDVELVNEIANRLQMKAEITFDKWPVCKKMLQNKEADIILGLEIFSDMEGVEKTIATSNDKLIVFGKEEINGIASLYKKKVGLMANSIIERIFDLNCEYVEYYTYSDVLEALDKGEIDFGICHGAVASKIIEEKKYNIFPTVTLMESFPAIGVRKDIPELCEILDSIILQLEVDGITKKLDEKWLVNYTYKRSLKEVFHREMRFYIYYAIFFVVTLLTLCLIYAFLYTKERDYKKNMEYQKALRKQNDILKSVAGVYNTMHVINIVEDTVQEVATSDQVKQYVNKATDAVEQMRFVMRNTVIPEDVEMALNFTDLATINSRMKNVDTLLAEFRGTEIGWFCAQFIVVERDPFGDLVQVMFTTQSIDGMKKEKERLLKISSYDELTMLFNRRAYSEKLVSLKEHNNKNATVMVFDVNQLKHVNDTLGHPAGDELICGASAVLKTVFDPIGSCYRIGGDEFIVILDKDIPNLSDYENKFNQLVEQWQGTKCRSMSVSYGYASGSEIPDFSSDNYEEVIKLADTRMYKSKAEFYKKKGIERRG